MQFDKNAAAAIAASLNSPSGVRTNESRPVTEEDIINLEANLEEAGDIMLQSTIPTADDLPNDGAPPINPGRHMKPPGPKAIVRKEWEPALEKVVGRMEISGTHLVPSGSMKEPWRRLYQESFYGIGGEPGIFSQCMPWESENPEAKFRTTIMAGIKKHSDDCKQNMVNGRFSTHLQIHCYSVMKAKDNANKTKKAQAAIKLQKANEARRLNESEETNLGLRNRMRGVSAPAGPTGPDVSDAVAVLGAQPTSSGKLDTSVLDYGIGKCIVLLFVYNNYII